jgi:hypothetical protein
VGIGVRTGAFGLPVGLAIAAATVGGHALIRPVRKA